MSIATERQDRQSPSLEDLEKSLQNVNAMLQSAPPAPPKPVGVVYWNFRYVLNKGIAYM